MVITSPPQSARILFFFNDTATTEIYTLSLHDALPILFLECPALHYPPLHIGKTDAERALSGMHEFQAQRIIRGIRSQPERWSRLYGNIYAEQDRKSTRLNSSHTVISYAVFCLTIQRNC